MSYFDGCTTLAELNARRISLTKSVDLVELNNEYNTFRQRILQSRVNYAVIPFIQIAEPVINEQKFCAIPVKGKNTEVGVIALTKEGFLI